MGRTNRRVPKSQVPAAVNQTSEDQKLPSNLDTDDSRHMSLKPAFSEQRETSQPEIILLTESLQRQALQAILCLSMPSLCHSDLVFPLDANIYALKLITKRGEGKQDKNTEYSHFPTATKSKEVHFLEDGPSQSSKPRSLVFDEFVPELDVVISYENNTT